ncbi:MAG TPA: hypothetical protein DCE42_16725 [Myxococcales bacterium]|nr:hypothetical protein [Deltaproteobacteria bacterium]MBU53965.1 hypothetical protein [Deltaproteobacteria bacterium]HAA56412.1 hypothetical protein [Myxococcales bacterium]
MFKACSIVFSVLIALLIYPLQDAHAACSKGSYGITVCKKCPAGTYAYKDVLFTNLGCKKCPAGTYSKAGSRSCQKCPWGSFAPGKGNSKCYSCMNHKTTTQKGATSKSQCRYCPAGQYAPGGVCKKCPLGTAYSRRSMTCVVCPSGTFSNKMGSLRCTPCPKGTASRSHKATSCRQCPAGKYASSIRSLQCKRCPFGRISKPGAHRCEKCPSGSIAKNNKCVPCPKGTYNDSKRNRCVPCEKGTANGRTGRMKCYACSAGYFASKTGQSACTPCPKGTASNASKATSCKKCSSGTYADYVGAAQCRPCPSGTFRDKKLSRCIPKCPVGQRLHEGRCTKCLTGTYWYTQNKCAICPRGQTTSGMGASSRRACKVCPKNTYTKYEPYKGSFFVSCKMCPNKKKSPPGSTSISACK